MKVDKRELRNEMRYGNEKRHEETKAEQWRGFEIRQQQMRQNETRKRR